MRKHQTKHNRMPQLVTRGAFFTRLILRYFVTRSGIRARLSACGGVCDTPFACWPGCKSAGVDPCSAGRSGRRPALLGFCRADGHRSPARTIDMPGVPGAPSTSSARSLCGRDAPDCRQEPGRSLLCPVHQRKTLSVIQHDDPLDQPLAIILQPLHIRHESREKGALIIVAIVHRVLLPAPLRRAHSEITPGVPTMYII